MDWLKNEAKEDIILFTDKITIDYVKNICPDMLVRYNYRHLITEDILYYLENRAIKLYISLLTWNRGADPNLWSFLEDTPKGASVHVIDRGIDPGNIIAQKEVYFNEDRETLRSSYKTLHNALQILFKDNWDKIKKGKLISRSQTGGSFHFKREIARFETYINEKGWDL